MGEGRTLIGNRLRWARQTLRGATGAQRERDELQATLDALTEEPAREALRRLLARCGAEIGHTTALCAIEAALQAAQKHGGEPKRPAEAGRIGTNQSLGGASCHSAAGKNSTPGQGRQTDG